MDTEKIETSKTIALFGGTGFVGSVLCRLLLARGFSVRMLVRPTVMQDGKYREDRPKQAHRLFCVEGDLSSNDAIRAVLTGADACVITTGPRSGSLEDMNTVVEGTRMIVESMQSMGVKRLIKLSGVSVRIQHEPFPLARRLLDIGLGIAMKNQSRSKYMEQAIIEDTNLDWTVVRPPVIKPGRSSKTLNSHEYAFLGLFVCVENLCEFFLDLLEAESWIKKSPTVGSFLYSQKGQKAK